MHGIELIHNDRYIKQHFDPLQQQLRLTVNLYGTPFQHRVWQMLNQIPRGQSLSYQQIAHLIGQPKAARAVGQAVGRNPVSYLTPCHRVKPANGQIGHFRWGADIKQHLLQSESTYVSTSLFS